MQASCPGSPSCPHSAQIRTSAVISEIERFGFSGSGSAVAGAPESCEPQFPQNASPGSTLPPQLGQRAPDTCSTGAAAGSGGLFRSYPQTLQTSASCGILSPQFGQSISIFLMPRPPNGSTMTTGSGSGSPINSGSGPARSGGASTVSARLWPHVPQKTSPGTISAEQDGHTVGGAIC